MADVPMKQAPDLVGWVIAAAVAAVAVGLTRIVWDWPWAAALFVAVILFLIVGVILGLPGRELPPKQTPVQPANTLAPGAPMAAPAPAPAPAPAAVAAPVAAPAAPLMAAPAAQKKPEGLTAARGGKADDLKIIKGIGPKLEQLCHKLGFYHFDQVAAWTAEEVAWVDENLEGFRGRVTRDRWVPQAQAIVKLGPQEFLTQLEAGKEF